MLIVERTFQAPVEMVWKVWTSPEYIQKWWGPGCFTAPVIKSDLRVGGSYHFAMQGPDGKTNWNTGKYLEIIPHKQIAATMSFADESGAIIPASQLGLPGQWPAEVIWTTLFHDEGETTRVIVSLDGIPEEMTEMARLGWLQQLEKFDELMS